MPKYQVSPRSREEIRSLTRGIRKTLGLERAVNIDVLVLLENVFAGICGYFSYQILDDAGLEEMAKYVPADNTIYIRESVYKGAKKGVGRDRFTIMHEIGHYFLHRNEKVALARGNIDIPAFRDSEWQADVFAGEFLMDINVVQGMRPEEIMVSCGVSLSAARCQYKQYQKMKKTG